MMPSSVFIQVMLVLQSEEKIIRLKLKVIMNLIYADD